jgi:hypothetical protein
MYDASGRAISTDNPLAVQEVGSSIIKPVDIQSRLAQTVQTHNAVNVGANTWSEQTIWIDCDGFDKIGFTILNDAATNNNAQVIWSNDGATKHGEDVTIGVMANQRRSLITDIKARYAKLSVQNGDTISHTMSAWAYLKA